MSVDNGGCPLGSAGRLGVVLESAHRAHPAERQGTAPVLTGSECGSAAFDNDPACPLDAVDGSVELRGNLCRAAHAVGAGASNSRG